MAMYNIVSHIPFITAIIDDEMILRLRPKFVVEEKNRGMIPSVPTVANMCSNDVNGFDIVFFHVGRYPKDVPTIIPIDQYNDIHNHP